MIIFGDRPNTDIKLGHNAGIDTCLTLTGVVKNEDEAYEWGQRSDGYQPTWVMSSLGADPNQAIVQGRSANSKFIDCNFWSTVIQKVNGNVDQLLAELEDD